MRRLLCAIVVATTTAGLLAPAEAAAPRRPSGTYTGDGGRFTLKVTGRWIQIAAFDFRCRGTTGRTSLNQIRIRRARGRWRFSIRMHGSVTYRDDHPDENARVRFSGRFSPTARSAAGTFAVSAPHCGATGTVEWTARR